jgi:hypothetical protein
LDGASICVKGSISIGIRAHSLSSECHVETILLGFDLSYNEKGCDCQESRKTDGSHDPNDRIILLFLSILNDEGIEHTGEKADSVLEFCGL